MSKMIKYLVAIAAFGTVLAASLPASADAPDCDHPAPGATCKPK